MKRKVPKWIASEQEAVGKTMESLMGRARRDPRYVKMHDVLAGKVRAFWAALPKDEEGAYRVLSEHGGRTVIIARWVAEGGEDFWTGGSLYGCSAHSLLKDDAARMWLAGQREYQERGHD